METLSYTTIDRTGWEAGPWNGEPDKIQWPDADTGLPCLAVRHPQFGHWCGYVGVTQEHPLFEKKNCDLDVHGGVTFADTCDMGANECESICRIPGPGESDRIWWLGFDCAHVYDFQPGLEALSKSIHGYPLNGMREGTYRTLVYVQAECADLAKQLVEMEAKDV